MNIADPSQSKSPSARRRTIGSPSAKSILLLVLLAPFAMGQEFAGCSLLAGFLQGINETVRITSTEVFSSCSSCFQSVGGRDYFDIPTAPEQVFIATFTVRGLDGVADVGDVRCFLVHKRCGPIAVDSSFEVTMVEDGLGLKGEIRRTPSGCIAFGQRSPAFWEVIIQRTGSVGIEVEWEISYVEFATSAQPVLPLDP